MLHGGGGREGVQSAAQLASPLDLWLAAPTPSLASVFCPVVDGVMSGYIPLQMISTGGVPLARYSTLLLSLSKRTLKLLVASLR